MRKMILAAAAAVSLAALAGAALAQVSADAPHIAAAVAQESRPAEDRARDDARKPAEMLAFAGVEPGDHVADLIPGGGYFTRLLAGAVGPEGRVYAVVAPLEVAPQYAEMVQGAVSAHPNAVLSPQNFMQMTFAEPLDLVFTAQNYHDLHIARFGLDAAQINTAVFNALKPGGVYVVIDHSAAAGSDLSVADTLHRIDQAIVIREVTAAGFVYEGELDVLRNPADDRTVNVFDPAIRGRTDQFVLLFRKP